ncbi:MAG: adenylyltransferase/cytidyltransferase family protein [Candidatus Bathyarchaeota archaeon]|nr:adenylyltransferase/cytidyltransferase family protein [Candidatus Bathyarchaeota archaeon]
MKRIVVSGYFNPLHVGHLCLLNAASRLGDNIGVVADNLIVIVNNDKQVALKGSTLFMNEDDRVRIMRSLQVVDWVVLSIDNDLSVCETLRSLKPDIFANGGDRTKDNIPETKVCQELGIEMIFGVGGDKVESSSKLLEQVLSE